MYDGYIQHPLFSRGELRCEFERTLKGEYCTEDGKVQLDGLRLCERHAQRLCLQERLAYWRAILAHIELWSGEARRRGRGDVVSLLEDERARTWAALERVCEDLQGSQNREDGDVSRNGKVNREGEDGEDGEEGEEGSGNGRAPPPW